MSTTVPFVTYFLAIIFMALVCGFWPGMAAVVLSVLGGWFLFLPPAFSFVLRAEDVWAVAVFALVASITVALTSGLVAALLIEDDRQKFLIQELRHRSQNLFAVIQTIVSRSFVEGQTLAQAKHTLDGRLAALARTHAMLADRAWVGAPLQDIVQEELTGFVQQVTVTGCDLVINTTAAQNFALIVHELATNAAKHGALSAAEGLIKISGSIETVDGHEQFRFVWRESGGPPAAAPARRGFGSAILFNMAKSFGQSVEAFYRPEGLTYELLVLLSAIAPPPSGIAPHAEASRP